MDTDISAPRNAAPDNGDLLKVANLFLDGAGAEELVKVAAELPALDAILDGSVTKMPPNTENLIATSYAITASLIYELKERNDKLLRDGIAPTDFDKQARMAWFEQADRVIAFIADNFPHEIIITGMRAATDVHRLPFYAHKMPTFVALVEKYAKYLMID